MTDIEIISDTPTKHRILFKTPISFMDKFKSAYEKEKDNLTIVDKYIRDFNNQNDNIVSEYNYEIITDTNFNVILLFKHMFRALGTTRKYAKFNVDIIDDTITLKFGEKMDINLKTKGKHDHIPITLMRASYVLGENEIHNTIDFETVDDVETYKCYTMLTTTIRDGITDIIKEIEQSDSSV